MGMENKHLVVIGDARHMDEVPDESVQLIATSPPCFDMSKERGDSTSPDSFCEYLNRMQLVFNECFRTLENGRYICVNACDATGGHPTSAHYFLLLRRAGFEYREDILWREPSAQGRAGMGKRPGLLMRGSSSMLQENAVGHILVLRKGGFDCKKLSEEEKEQAAIDIGEARRHWSSDARPVWLEEPGDQPRLTFPEDILEVLIRLYTCEGETVLDPFLGSGTSAKAAAGLRRRSISYEPNRSCLPLVMQRSGIAPGDMEVIYQRRRFE
jgi:site-specific DNA-methyltransferase (adenine-specific)